MTDDDEPELVISEQSGEVVVDGIPFLINIFRMEDETNWVLEVVDHGRTRHLWDNEFRSESDARAAALRMIDGTGTLAISGDNNVVPFRKI